MRRLAIHLLLLLLLLCATRALADDTQARATIVHVPLNETLVGEAVLVFEVREPQLAGTVTVHVVSQGGAGEPVRITALRNTRGYEAVIPERLVVPPGFEYFVTEHMPDGSERAVFADRAAPHTVRVTHSVEKQDELARLAEREGQRSTVTTSFEWVDFGDRELDGFTVHDRYYRIEAGYAYSFLTRVDAIRLSLVRVRGEGATWSDGMPPSVEPTRLGIDCGRAEVTLLGTDALRLRGAVLLGASQQGFEYGGGASLVFGDPHGASLDFGVESITTLGATGRLRLGFAAVPRVPMGAAIEVTTFPTGEDAGVRLLYDVGYRFGPVTQLALRAGYQGRTSVTGGPAFGATFDYGF